MKTIACSRGFPLRCVKTRGGEFQKSGSSAHGGSSPQYTSNPVLFLLHVIRPIESFQERHRRLLKIQIASGRLCVCCRTRGLFVGQGLEQNGAQRGFPSGAAFPDFILRRAAVTVPVHPPKKNGDDRASSRAI